AARGVVGILPARQTSTWVVLGRELSAVDRARAPRRSFGAHAFDVDPHRGGARQRAGIRGGGGGRAWGGARAEVVFRIDVAAGNGATPAAPFVYGDRKRLLQRSSARDRTDRRRMGRTFAARRTDRRHLPHRRRHRRSDPPRARLN